MYLWNRNLSLYSDPVLMLKYLSFPNLIAFFNRKQTFLIEYWLSISLFVFCKIPKANHFLHYRYEISSSSIHSGQLHLEEATCYNLTIANGLSISHWSLCCIESFFKVTATTNWIVWIFKLFSSFNFFTN